MEFKKKIVEEENLQRVFKNNGKRFEEDFKASFGDHIWTYRPPDTGGGMMARFTSESLCDLMAYNTITKNFILLELKSTLGTSVNFRPYEQCMEYERLSREFNEWNKKQDAKTRAPIKDEIQKHKGYIKQLYKATNESMIKYHQIKSLLEAKENYNIDTFIAITFLKTTATYAVPIQTFTNFWKHTKKKSINEADLDDLVLTGQAYSLNKSYIRRSMKSVYEVDQLTNLPDEWCL